MRLSLGPAASSKLRKRRITSAEQTQVDGLYWFRPYDLENGFGAEGAAIATAVGHRYLWLGSSDHYNANECWADGGGIWKGYSDDPGIIPLDWSQMLGHASNVEDILFTQLETPWLVYNPTDANDRVFYMFCHGNTISDGGLGQETVLFTSDDLATWVAESRSHKTTTTNGHTGYHTVYRRAEDDWESYGLGGLTNNPGKMWRWTSTDGLVFTREHQLPESDGGLWGWLPFQGGIETTIGAKRYILCHAGKTGAGTMPAFIPVDALGDPDIDDEATEVIPLTEPTAGTFPTPLHVQGVSGYVEDGVYHAYLARSFFRETHVSYLDYYTYVVDATAAADAAPVGVRASSVNGVARINWYDALPNQTYRVETSDAADGEWTELAEVESGHGYRHTDAPANEVSFYKVTTLNGESDGGSRIVSTYVSSSSALINQHVTRALAGGADVSTIDKTWMATVETWLRDNNLLGSLMHWVDPKFGVKLDGSAILKAYDLGTTLRPFSGDLTPLTANTTYSATGVNNTPGIVNTVNTARCYFNGVRHNPLRRKTGLTCFAAYTKSISDNAALFGLGGTNGINLFHASGNPGNGSFSTAGSGSGSSSLAFQASGPHVLGGIATLDSVQVICDGVMGTPAATTRAALVLAGQNGQVSDMARMVVGSPTAQWRHGTGFISLTNTAKFNLAAAVMLDVALTEAQCESITELLQTRLGV